MDPASLPAGGLPWILAVPAFVFVVGVAAGVVKWMALRSERRDEEAVARVEAAHAAKETLRAELMARLEACERRGDALEKEFRSHLDKSIDILAAAKRGIAEVPAPRPRPSTLDAKKAMYRTLSETISPDVLAAARRLIEEGQ